MILLCLVVFIVATEAGLAQFNPTVTIECLNDVGNVKVTLTDASTSGKVSLVVGNELCAEQNTTSTSTVITFLQSTGCPGPATSYPTLGNMFHIYVAEEQRIQAGYPDELYEVTCYANNSDTTNQVNVSSIYSGYSINASITPSASLEITDLSDVAVTSLVIGTSYKLKINCLDQFASDFDVALLKITANTALTLIDNGCTTGPTVFNNPTYPSQCQMQVVFYGFLVAGSTPPLTITLDAWAEICPGNCTQASCGTRRKRRYVSGTEENITVHLFKEIVIYPKNETEETNEATTTTTAITQKEKEKCFSDPLVYVLIALLLILAVVTVALGILLFLARRSTSQGSQGSCDSKEWWENKRHLRESSDLAARKY